MSNPFIQGENDLIIAAVDSVVTALPNDSTLDALKTIDVLHSRTHDGYEFTGLVYQADLAAASALNIFITAPASAWKTHITITVETDGTGTWIWSDGTDASGGTSIKANNHFIAKQLTITAQTVLTSDALVTSTGNILDRGIIGSAGKFSVVGGEGEWIAESGDEAILVFTADASCRTVIRSNWYEVAE